MLIALATLAHGAEPKLAWDWDDGEQHRFVVTNQVDLSDWLWIGDETNLDERMNGWWSRFDLLCTGEGERRRTGTMKVACRIDSADFDPRAVPNREARARQIADGWETLLTGASVQFTLRPDGRVTAHDLVEVDFERSNRRTRTVHQVLRAVIGRSLAGLEVALPEDGDASAQWMSSHALAMTVPSAIGNVGKVRMVSEVVSVAEEDVTVSARGSGTRGWVNERYPNTLWSFESTSLAVFDTSLGVVGDHQAYVRGELTSLSSLTSGNGLKPIPYVQQVRAQRMPL